MGIAAPDEGQRRVCGMKVFISVCCHRAIEPLAVDCLIRTLSNPAYQFEYAFQMEAGIDRSRSIQATRFLEESNADVLLFLDDDILYNLEEVPRIIEDAIEKQSIVCGPYSKKEDGGQINCVPLHTEDIKMGPGGKLMEICWGATGFMAIPRNVPAKMSVGMQKAKIKSDLAVYPFFLPMLHEVDGDLIWLSEDYAFCQRAREAGFKVWMDTRLQIGHLGNKIYVPGM
jgi:hypothetical protein